MKIATFNTKNIFFKKMSSDKLNFITNLILDNKIDIIGTQELSRESTKDLYKKLYHLDYKFYGKFRYKKLYYHFPMNENNNIVTNKKVDYHETIKLKTKSLKMFFLKIRYFPIVPRIASVITFKDDKYDNMCVINTHISDKVSFIQKRQIKVLKEIVKKYKEFKIVITGDFNMEPDNKVFIEFNDFLNNIGIKRVVINEPTWHSKNKDKILDYIFVSKEIKVKNKKRISSENYSDHDLLYVEI